MALRIDFEGVESCITQMETAIEALQQTAADIDGIVETNLGEHWEGNSYQKCISTYEENYQNMLTTQVPDLVEQLKQFMQTCKDCLEEADNELAGN